MDIKSQNDGLLTNLEVIDLIKERKEQRDRPFGHQIDLQPRIALEHKVTDYVSKSVIGTLTGEKLRECMSKIKALRLRLSDEEMVQIANLLPASEVEMYLIVTNAAERLSEEQIAELLGVITSYLPGGVSEDSASS